MIPSLLHVAWMPVVDPIARTGELAVDDEPAAGDVIVPPSSRRSAPALPLPISTRRASIPPDAAFSGRAQAVLDRRARETSSDADEVLSGHRGPITAGD